MRLHTVAHGTCWPVTRGAHYCRFSTSALHCNTLGHLWLPALTYTDALPTHRCYLAGGSGSQQACCGDGPRYRRLRNPHLLSHAHFFARAAVAGEPRGGDPRQPVPSRQP